MFLLTLVTPDKSIIKGVEVEEVFVPGYMGELNLLPGHAPLVTTLSTGVLRYRLKGESRLQHVAVSWGYCQVNPLGVNVLAETAEKPDDIDVERAKLAKKLAHEYLAKLDSNPEAFPKYIRKAERAEVRISVGTNNQN